MSAPTIDLESGRYYARWLELGVGVQCRIVCACGFVGPWHLGAMWLAEKADRLHRAH